MKKFTYLATALLLLAGAAGCKKNADVQDPEIQPSGKTRTVTISAGQASEKTSVNHGVITWSANDKLFISPMNSGKIGLPLAALNIASGMGTTQGTFTGEIDASIEDDTQLLAFCGGDWTCEPLSEKVPYIVYLNIPTTQTYVADGIYENTFPSVGVGTIKDGIPMLNNVVAGVLCLNVKGETTDKVKSITVSADNKFAGRFGVSPETLPDPGASEVTLTCPAEGVALSPEGSKFYIVAFSRNSCTFTVTVTKTDDTSFECSLGDAFKVTAGTVTTKDVENKPATKGKAYATAVGGDVNWVQLWAGGPKWAEYNVGASSVGSYGGYYYWGSAINKDPNGAYASSITRGGENDTAFQLWGSNWQMPTKDNFESLVANCDETWTTQGGISGRLFTGKGDYSDNSVFFPAAGMWTVDSGTDKEGVVGLYWSCTPDGDAAAYRFGYTSSMGGFMSTIFRADGYQIRPVLQ